MKTVICAMLLLSTPTVLAYEVLGSESTLAPTAPFNVPALSIGDAADLLRAKGQRATELDGLRLGTNGDVKKKNWPVAEDRLQEMARVCSTKLVAFAPMRGYATVVEVSFWVIGDGCAFGKCVVGCTGVAVAE